MEKVKLIQGNLERAEEIRKTLEEWGGLNEYNFSFKHEDTYYYVDQFDLCRCLTEEIAKELVAKGKAEIYELPKPQCEFKPFDKVLVRDDSQSKWNGDFFTHMDEDGLWHICISGAWLYCIPYEGNEALLGTNDNPK